MDQERVALVTGGSRGIGRAIAEALAQAGLSVVLSYQRREEEAQAVVAGIKGAGGRASALRADVGDPAQARALAQAVIESHGRVDVLVNNAGVHLPGTKLADTPGEEWDRI